MRNMIYKNILLLKKTIKIMLFFIIKNYFMHIFKYNIAYICKNEYCERYNINIIYRKK